jgi:hypothetical protein
MQDRFDHARGWLLKGDSDLLAGKQVVQRNAVLSSLPEAAHP